MPKVDWDDVDESDDYTVPTGRYLCEVAKIDDDDRTQFGDEMWHVEYHVAEGEYAGRRIWDNLVFSRAAMKRVKLVCSRLGLDCTGEMDLTPDRLLKKRCYLDVVREPQKDDRTRFRNSVPFAGVHSLEKGAKAPPAASAVGDGDGENLAEENLPF